jgi:hypothetical protein
MLWLSNASSIVLNTHKHPKSVAHCYPPTHVRHLDLTRFLVQSMLSMTISYSKNPLTRYFSSNHFLFGWWMICFLHQSHLTHSVAINIYIYTYRTITHAIWRWLKCGEGGNVNIRSGFLFCCVGRYTRVSAPINGCIEFYIVFLSSIWHMKN